MIIDLNGSLCNLHYSCLIAAVFLILLASTSHLHILTKALISFNFSILQARIWWFAIVWEDSHEADVEGCYFLEIIFQWGQFHKSNLIMNHFYKVSFVVRANWYFTTQNISETIFFSLKSCSVAHHSQVKKQSPLLWLLSSHP